MIPSEEGVSMGSLEVVLDFVPALELRVVSTCAAKLSLSGVCTVFREPLRNRASVTTFVSTEIFPKTGFVAILASRSTKVMMINRPFLQLHDVIYKPTPSFSHIVWKLED